LVLDNRHIVENGRISSAFYIMNIGNGIFYDVDIIARRHHQQLQMELAAEVEEVSRYPHLCALKASSIAIKRKEDSRPHWVKPN